MATAAAFGGFLRILQHIDQSGREALHRLAAASLTMCKIPNLRFFIPFKPSSARLLLLVSCVGMLLLLAARGLAETEVTREKNPSDAPKDRSTQIVASPTAASKLVRADLKQGMQDPEN